MVKTTVICLKKMQSDRKGSYNSCIMYAVSQMEFLSFAFSMLIFSDKLFDSASSNVPVGIDLCIGKWNQSGILLKCMATSQVFLFVLIEDLWFLTVTLHSLVVDPTYWRLHPLQWTKFNNIKGTIWQSFLSLSKICFVSLQTENFFRASQKIVTKITSGFIAFFAAWL